MIKPDISEWIAKAEGDFTTALRENRARITVVGEGVMCLTL